MRFFCRSDSRNKLRFLPAQIPPGANPRRQVPKTLTPFSSRRTPRDARLARRRASSHSSFWGSSAPPNSIIRAGGEGRVCARQTRKPRRPPKIWATYATARIDASELSTTTSSLVIANSGLLVFSFVRGQDFHQMDAIILTSINLRLPHGYVAQLLAPNKAAGRNNRKAYARTRE